jgi:hypothetical protein
MRSDNAMGVRNVQISKLARELKLDTRRLIEELRQEGVLLKSRNGSISKELANKIYGKHNPPCHGCGQPLQRGKTFGGCCYSCYCKRRLSAPGCRECGQKLDENKRFRGFCYACYCKRHQPIVRGMVQGGSPGLPKKRTSQIGQALRSRSGDNSISRAPLPVSDVVQERVVPKDHRKCLKNNKS